MKKVAVNLRLVRFCLTLFILNKKTKNYSHLIPNSICLHFTQFDFVLFFCVANHAANVAKASYGDQQT
ncbi:hypothetical protein [Vibrio parahaemolyticus]|uniref:hypothetical protein n=1 Tax=Vibrio parahaemolyticus TaxID=670 RepID=UPI000A395E22|nr:hypothetical protein [Vibrio parahaemolyticus]OUD73582.1 hypothetical protein BTN34_02965 [Vibrio parahaemolyticus]OUD76206.1 hypothetical protein BTN60_02965 [Vibrio parahaemolyticus]